MWLGINRIFPEAIPEGLVTFYQRDFELRNGEFSHLLEINKYWP